VRALEGVVQYRPEAPRRGHHGDGRDRRASSVDGPPAGEPSEDSPAQTATEGSAGADSGLPTPSEGRRRRRRRRGRRSGSPAGIAAGAANAEETFSGTATVNGEDPAEIEGPAELELAGDVFEPDESGGGDDDTDLLGDPEAE
jgi:hypothetical protein